MERPGNNHRSSLLILGLIVALAALLRFSNLSLLGFWTDELLALSSANGYGVELVHVPVNQIAPPRPVCTRLAEARPFWQIPHTLAHQDAHPPLYFMLLRLWEQMFGQSESAVRSLNVLFSLAAVILLYFAAAESIGSTAALVACLLMAVASPQIQYAQEARNYMLVLPLSLIAFISLRRVGQTSGRETSRPEVDSKRDSLSDKEVPLRGDRCSIAATAVLFASLLGMLLTHYFAVAIVAAFGLESVIAMKGRARLHALAAIMMAVIVFLSLWGWAIFDERSVIQNVDWLTDKDPGHLTRRLLDLCRLPVRFFCEIVNPQAQLLVGAAGAALYIGMLSLLRRRELRLWIYVIIANVGLVAAADLMRSTTQLNWVRYALFATPSAYVLLAAALPGRWRFMLPAIATIASLLCLWNAYVPPWKIDYRSIVEQIDRLRGPDDALVITGPMATDDEVTYAAFRHYTRSMPAVSAILTAPPTGQTLDQLRKCRHVWVIAPGKEADLPGLKVLQEQRLPYCDLLEGTFDLSP